MKIENPQSLGKVRFRSELLTVKLRDLRRSKNQIRKKKELSKMKSSCVDGQKNNNTKLHSPKLTVNKKIKSQLAIPHSKDQDNWECKSRGNPSPSSGSGNPPYVWAIKGIPNNKKEQFNKMKSNIEDNEKNSQNVLCIDMKKSKFKSSLAIPSSNIPKQFKSQVGGEQLSSKQTSKRFQDNSFTKDSSKQKRHGWIKVKSTCGMRPSRPKNGSKKNSFLK